MLFNHSIKTTLWPTFKKLGYKKSGNNFRYYSPEGWGKIVQFQKSQGNSAAEQSFTVNIGLYLPEFEFYHCNNKAKLNFHESICAVRKRLGHLKSVRRDEWYKLTNSTDIEQVFTELSIDFEQYVLPYLASITSREDIYKILVDGHQSHYPSTQIEAMYQAGYHEAAINLFKKKISRSKANSYYQDTLHNLARRLGLSIAP